MSELEGFGDRDGDEEWLVGVVDADGKMLMVPWGRNGGGMGNGVRTRMGRNLDSGLFGPHRAWERDHRTPMYIAQYIQPALSLSSRVLVLFGITS